ncbi:MAG: phosphocholine cytidylyltransferase family protein [Psychromonas sp.]|nr:phosphocholine cytidylyltransferase family protein [Psychromonas sp.]
MKALILAAGRGSRMNDLTEHRPKCLVKLNGKTLLAYQLAALQEAGITDIGIVTGYRAKMLRQFNLTEFHNARWSQTNMVHSLSCAKTWLKDDCIISYSDIFYSASAVTLLIKTKADIAITYDPNWLELWKNRFEDPLSDAETFRINDHNELMEIGGKPQNIEQVQGQYMGLLKFTPIGWARLEELRQTLTPELRDKIHMTGALQNIIKRRILAIKAIPYLERWGEVDSAEDLACYH